MGKIYVVMGKSATGKDTIYKELLKSLNDSVKQIVLYTTRPIRENERNGVEYFFVTEDHYQKFLREGKIIEQRAYDTMCGLWRYFTVNDNQIDLQEQDYLMINTLEAYDQIKNYFGEEAVVPIYIEVETGERLQRALNRERVQDNPKYTELCRRFLADEEDFSEENIKARGIHKKYQNNQLEDCVEEILTDLFLL